MNTPVRYDDNGWRKVIKDWGIPGLFIAAVFWGGMTIQVVAQNKENVKTNTETAAATLKIVNKQAEINAEQTTAIKSLEETVRMLLQNQLVTIK